MFASTTRCYEAEHFAQNKLRNSQLAKEQDFSATDVQVSTSFSQPTDCVEHLSDFCRYCRACHDKIWDTKVALTGHSNVHAWAQSGILLAYPFSIRLRHFVCVPCDKNCVQPPNLCLVCHLQLMSITITGTLQGTHLANRQNEHQMQFDEDLGLPSK